MPRAPRPTVAVVLALLVVATAGAGSPAGAPRLGAHRFPAAGDHQATLTIPRTGRYRIAVSSGTGVALALVDRMRGVVARGGVVGITDGRLDLLLDPGAYLVLLRGDRRARGEATLSAQAFHDARPGPVPVLEEARTVTTPLGDLERRAFWIDVVKRGPVTVEAAGRHLEAMDLWRGGRYRVPVDALSGAQVGTEGRPLQEVRLAAVLDPGRYLVTCWGGPGLPWAAGGQGQPLVVRLGMRRLPRVAVIHGKVPDLGLVRYRLAPGRFPSAVALRLDHPGDASMDLATVTPGQVPPGAYPSGKISKKQRHPTVVLDTQGSDSGQELTVYAAPGTGYTLTVLAHPDQLPVRVKRQGDYWLSVVGTGAPDDGLQPTGILTDGIRDARRRIAGSLPHLRRDAAFSQTLNLRGRTSALLAVDDPGTYRVTGSGVDDRFTLVRLETRWARHRRPPAPVRPGVERNLEAGIYELTLYPARAGVATVAVIPVGAGATSAGEPPRLRAALQIPRVHLRPDDGWAHRHDYTLVLGMRPGERRAKVLRKLPLDLTEALPVDLAPGIPVTLPVKVKAASRLRVEGAEATAKVDRQPCAAPCRLAPGAHTVTLSLGGGDEAVALVRLVPEAEARAAEGPVATRALPPPDPPLTVAEVGPGSPRFFDLPRQGSRTFRLEVQRPGVYRVETTGLLATTVTLRTRVALNLAAGVGGGDGRNGRVVRFLRRGEYLVRVTARGRSEGHGGIVVTRAPVIDGGALVAGRTARASVPESQGLAYAFTVARAGRYRLRTLALGQRPPARLTDDDGWPVTPPDGAPDVTLRLAPGRYHWLTEGVDVPGRRLTRLEALVPPGQVAGRGPHPLRLGASVRATWIQGDGKPDVYTFTLPAKVKVHLTLGSATMQAHVYRAGDASRTPVATVAPGGAFAGTLDAGAYRLEVVCSRVDTRVPYTVGLTVDALVAGTTRTVSVPGSVDVVVARAGTVVLGSFGDVDVRGVLRDAAGRGVAEGDDLPDDWNFRVAPHLAPGRYRLAVEGVGGATGSTRVRLEVPRARAHPPVPAPGQATLALDGGVVTVPLPVTGAGLLRVRLDADVAVEATLVSRDGGRVLARGAGARVVLAVPVARGAAPRLRLLAETAPAAKVHLRVARLAPAAVPLAEGGIFRRVRTGALRLAVKRPGTFTVRPARGLRVSTAGGAAVAVDGGDVSLPAGPAWLLWPRAPGQVRLRRAVLDRRQRGLTLAPGPRRVLDVAPSPGLVLVRVTADGGRPAARFSVPAGAPPAADGVDLALGPRSALAAAPPGARRPLTLWNAEAGATAPLPVIVSRHAFPLGKAAPLASGSTTVALPAAGHPGAAARTFALPVVPVALHLGLSRGLAAVAWDAGGVRAVIDAVAGPVDRRLVVAATRLAVVDLAGRGGDAVIVRRAGSPARVPRLRSGRPVAWRFDAPGRLPLGVPARAGTLRLAGPATASALDADGHLAFGRHLALPNGGRVILRHGAGIVAAWLEDGGHPRLDRWGRLPAVAATPVAADAVVPLGGSALWLSVHLDRPSVLSVAAGRDVLVAVSRAVAAGPGRTVAARLGALTGDPLAAVAPGHLARALAAGDYLVGLRARAGGLAGVARLAADPIRPAPAGVGPASLLAGGETRVFAFSVPTARRVGVGVRASADVVDADLLDAAGARLADGRQALVDLKPGRYLLRVRCPAGRGPVRIAPVVLGLNAPGDGPPPKALTRLLDSAGLVPARAPEGK